MSVYVDSAFIKYGRMSMCHMMADSTEELLAMAARLGLRRTWIQRPGEPGEHFDVCKAKRAEAIAFGAVEVTGRDLVRIVQQRREVNGKQTEG